MAWWGKALGGAFGFMIGGPLGALMGIAFGHNFDRGMHSLGDTDWQGGAQDRIQAAFFTATFSVMGYIAKADGKVTRDEIKLAESVMSHLGLPAEMRESARKLFNEGKSRNFPIDEVLDQFERRVVTQLVERPQPQLRRQRAARLEQGELAARAALGPPPRRALPPREPDAPALDPVAP